MKDTIRLILFLECNLKCSYCCNEQEQFNSQFIKMKLEDIDFSKYENVCITGGEPFLNFDIIWNTINYINDNFPNKHKFFIYTNGLKIQFHQVILLNNLIDVIFNIGLHTLGQLNKIDQNIFKVYGNFRFMINEKLYDKALLKYPNRLNKDNLKKWIMNDCNMPNEDWVLLEN